MALWLVEVKLRNTKTQQSKTANPAINQKTQHPIKTITYKIGIYITLSLFNVAYALSNLLRSH